MKLKLKEDPKEWRKITLQTVVAVSVISSVLRWRKTLSIHAWVTVLVVCGVIALLALAFPKLFRQYYVWSSKVGFWLSKIMGHIVLAVFFALVLTPFGLILRLTGKDLLKLKKGNHRESYWCEAKPNSSLDKMF